MSNRVNQPGRGRTAMGAHRGRPLTPLGARFHIVPKGWGGGSAGSSKPCLLGAQPGGLRDSRLLLGASAASSVGPHYGLRRLPSHARPALPARPARVLLGTLRSAP